MAEFARWCLQTFLSFQFRVRFFTYCSFIPVFSSVTAHNFGAVVFSGIEEIEKESQVQCGFRLATGMFKVNDEQKLDWFSEHMDKDQSSKSFEIVTNNGRMENFSIEMRKNILRSKDEYVSICTNILIPLPEVLPSSPIEFKNFAKYLPLVGRSVYDRYVFISEEHSILETFSKSFAIQLDALNLKVGIFMNQQQLEGSPGFFAEPPVYSGFMEHQQSVPLFLAMNRPNLRGRKITVTTTHLPPYFILKGDSEKDYDGFHFNIFKYGSESRNCTFIYDTKTKLTGTLQKNGSWTGMMKNIVDPVGTLGSTEIAMMMGINEARYIAVDYTHFVHQGQVIFVSAYPKAVVTWAALFYPFTLDMWLGLILIFVVLIPLLYISLSINSSNCPSGKKTKARKSYLAIYTPYAVSLEQSCELPVAGGSFRLIVGMWMFFTFLTGMAYKSNLVGYLSFPETEFIPETFEDLYEHKEYNLGFHYVGGAGFSLFNASSRVILKGLLKRFTLENEVDSCILKAAVNKKTVCIGWVSIITTAIARRLTLSSQIDPLRVSLDTAGYSYVAVALRRNSIFTNSINSLVGELRDTGHFEKWKENIRNEEKFHGKMWFDTQKDTAVYKTLKGVLEERLEANAVKPMTVKNFISVFSILVIGTLSSLISFVMEFRSMIVENIKFK